MCSTQTKCKRILFRSNPLFRHRSASMKVLVFAPHPDDEVIGCGGSILRHVERGAEVVVGYLTSGERAMSTLSIEHNGANREREAVDAGEILGVKQHHFFHFRDTYMEADAQTVNAVAQFLCETQP